MVNSIKIAIIGANGFVGKNLRKLFSTKNIFTVSIARKNFRAYKNETKIIVKDYSEQNISSKLKNCNVLIHLIGIGRQTVNSNYFSTNVKLTRDIIQLCKKYKIPKIIFNSGLGVSSHSTTDYFISKYNAEQEIIKSDLDYTIFRPSYIMGNDDYLTQSLRKQIRNKIIVIPGSGKYKIQPIFVNDACKVILQSTSSKKYSQKIIDLVGPEVISYRKLISQINCKYAKIKKINLEDAYCKALNNHKAIFGVDDLNILLGNFIGDFDKLKKLSGLKFTKYVDILKTSGLS